MTHETRNNHKKVTKYSGNRMSDKRTKIIFICKYVSYCIKINLSNFLNNDYNMIKFGAKDKNTMSNIILLGALTGYMDKRPSLSRS